MIVLWFFAAIATTALAYWFGTGIHPQWWLTWWAPVPVLVTAPGLRARWTFAAAFAAYFAGMCNEWHFLRDMIQIPLPVLLLAIMLPASLSFAAGVLLWRWLVLRRAFMSAALCFAAFWVTLEFVSDTFSVNGTAGSIAYSQADCLPVLQIASLAGLSGITFLLCFFAASLATLRASGSWRVPGVAFAVLAAAAGWGAWRLNTPVENLTRLRVGLAASDSAENIFPRQFPAGYYTVAESLFAQGAQLVVLPEKIARIAAADRPVFHPPAAASIVYGVETRAANAVYNEEILQGAQSALYRKHHMVPGFESHLTIGHERVKLNWPSQPSWGLEICKDMDFPRLSREYGKDGVGLMLVPAWDFVLDAWLHNRMAVVRGVENGFTIIRAAKQGLLTVSDSRGRVLAERRSDAAAFSTIITTVPVAHVATLYTLAGDWFAWLNAVCLATLALREIFARRA